MKKSEVRESLTARSHFNVDPFKSNFIEKKKIGFTFLIVILYTCSWFQSFERLQGYRFKLRSVVLSSVSAEEA